MRAGATVTAFICSGHSELRLHEKRPLFTLWEPIGSYSAKQENPVRIHKMGRFVPCTLKEKAVSTNLRSDGIFPSSPKLIPKLKSETRIVMGPFHPITISCLRCTISEPKTGSNIHNECKAKCHIPEATAQPGFTYLQTLDLRDMVVLGEEGGVWYDQL